MARMTLFSNWLSWGLGRTSNRERRKLNSRTPRRLIFESVEQRQLLSSVSIWTGGGTNNNFSTAANWQGGNVPQAGSQLIFQGTARTSPSNNLAAGTSFASIEIQSSGFNLKGNSLALTGNITVDSTAPVATISLNVALTGTTSVIVNGGALTVSGSISGVSGSVSESGGGTLTLSGTNSYGGGTTVSAGDLTASSGSAIPSTSAVFVATGATLTLASSDTIGSLAGSGNVSLGSKTLTVGTGNTTFSGAIGGTGGLTVTGGTLALDGTNTFTGTTTIDGGTLSLAGSASLAGNVVLANASGASLSLLSNESIGSLAGGGLSGGNVILNGNTLTVGENNLGSASYYGTIEDGAEEGGGLTKVGTDTLILAGSNSYTGLTQITAGTLQLGDGTTANGSVAGNIVDIATLDFANPNPESYGGNITGSGILSENGPGTLTLSGNNAYAGPTKINDGTLVVSNSGAILNTSAVVLANAAGAGLSLGNDVTIGSLAGGGANGGAVNLNGYTLTVGTANTSTYFSGNITGSNTGVNGLTKKGTGTLTLNGANNNYSGPTTIEGGALAVGASGAIPGTSAVILETGTRLNLSATGVAIGSLSDGDTIDGETGGGLVSLSTYTLNVGGDSTTTAFSGTITGSGGLTKTGTGTLTLSGNNTNSGAMTVDSGVLAVSGGSAIYNLGPVVLGGSGATLSVLDNETIGSLSGSGTVNLVNGSLNIIQGSGSGSFAGTLQVTGAQYPLNLGSSQYLALVAPAQASFVDNNGQTNADNAQYTFQDGGLTWDYEDNAALSNPIVYVNHEMTPNVPAADYVTVQLTLGGVAGPISYFDTSGFNSKNIIRLAAQANAGLPTGDYQYVMQVTECYNNSGPGQVIDYYGSTEVIDRSQSAFGSGWWLDSLYQVVPGTGGVSVVRGDGSAGWFADNGAPSGSGGYVSPQCTVGTLSNAANGGYLLSYPSGEHYEFNAQGLLTGYYNAQQQATTYTYNGDQLATITDPLGHVTTLSYTNGQLSSVTDFANRVTWFNDPSDELLSISLPDPNVLGGTNGPTTQFQYGAGNLMTSATDPVQNLTQYAYDYAGWLSTVTDPDGGVESITPEAITGLANLSVNSQTNLATTVLSAAADSVVIDPLGHKTTYTTDAFGNAISETDAAGKKWTYNRDNTSGRLTEMVAPGVDQNGNPCTLTTSYTYDQTSGNCLLVNYPDGSFETWTYDAYNNVTSQNVFSNTGQLVNETTYAYTYSLTSESFTTQQYAIITAETVTQVDLSGQGQNRVTQYTFADGTGGLPAGLLLTETDAQGTETVYQYGTDSSQGSFGQCIAVTTAYGTADAATTAYQYDPAGDLIAVSDPMSRQTHYTFDNLGRVTSESQTSADGTSMVTVDSYTYDLDGNLLSLTDAKGNETTWAYKYNEQVSQTNPLGTSSYGYDLDGNLVSATDNLGRTTSYTYNALNQETTENWLNSKGKSIYTIGYSYDPEGDLLSASDPSASYAYAYNSMGENTSAAASITGLAPTATLNQSYDFDGNRTQLAATIGTTADFANSYSYDSFGEMTSVQQAGVTGGVAVAPKLVNFSYNADGQFNTISRYADLAGNDLVVQAVYSYDSAQRLTGLSYTQGGTTLAGYSWSYDADNEVTQMTSADGTAIYGYDHTGALTSVQYTGAQAAESYSYDSAGNRQAANGTSYGAPGPDNEVLNDGTYSYAYDADGNCTSRTCLSNAQSNQYITLYTWDYRNRLTEVTYENNAGQITSQVAYSYDYANRLVEKIVNPGTATEQKTVFVYDGQNIALQFDGTVDGTSGNGGANSTANALSVANLSHRYLWGPAVDQILADEQVTSPSSPGTVVWPLTDNLGTVRDLATYNAATGTTTVVNHIVYDSFGNVVSQSNAAAAACLFGYTGQMFDQDTGLSYDLNRWYDSSTGRFMSQDPSGFFLSGDSNLYRYVGNSPTNFIDPLGLADVCNNTPNPAQKAPPISRIILDVPPQGKKTVIRGMGYQLEVYIPEPSPQNLRINGQETSIPMSSLSSSPYPNPFGPQPQTNPLEQYLNTMK